MVSTKMGGIRMFLEPLKWGHFRVSAIRKKKELVTAQISTSYLQPMFLAFDKPLPLGKGLGDGDS